jgi:hypothetical protein
MFLSSLPLSLFHSFYVLLSSWFPWSSSALLCFVELASVIAIFPLILSLWEKLSKLVNVWHWPPPDAQSWWIQWRFYGGWSVPDMLLLKLTELALLSKPLSFSPVFKGGVSFLLFFSFFTSHFSFSFLFTDVLSDLKTLYPYHWVIPQLFKLI